MQDPYSVFLRTVKLRCVFATLPPFTDAETSQTQDGTETRAAAESPRVASAAGCRRGGSPHPGGPGPCPRSGPGCALGVAAPGRPWARCRAAGRNRGGTQLAERGGLAVAACGKMTPHHEEQPRRGAGYGALAPDRCRAAGAALRNIPSKCGAAALLRACP